MLFVSIVVTMEINRRHYFRSCPRIWKIFVKVFHGARSKLCNERWGTSQRSLWQLIHFVCVWKFRSLKLGTDTSCLLHFLHETRRTWHISITFIRHTTFEPRSGAGHLYKIYRYPQSSWANTRIHFGHTDHGSASVHIFIAVIHPQSTISDPTLR